MITYELAKKLKDTGFPQKNTCSFSPTCRHGMDEGIECVYVPTLSELIEACGMPKVHGGVYCTDLKWGAWTKIKDEDGLEIVGHGSSSEEAVTNLWLALNKK